MVEVEQKLDGLSALEAKPQEELARRIRQRCGDNEVSSRFGTRTYRLKAALDMAKPLTQSATDVFPMERQQRSGR